ncbi:hypothetical protein MTO96_007621 [Rhipicephalus appendiculatus]
MYERVQQRNESSVVYFHAKVRLCKEANLDFWDTREQIITGLRSKQLSTMLLGKSHEDDDDILHDIQEFERIELPSDLVPVIQQVVREELDRREVAYLPSPRVREHFPSCVPGVTFINAASVDTYNFAPRP